MGSVPDLARHSPPPACRVNPQTTGTQPLLHRAPPRRRSEHVSNYPASRRAADCARLGERLPATAQALQCRGMAACRLPEAGASGVFSRRVVTSEGSTTWQDGARTGARSHTSPPGGAECIPHTSTPNGGDQQLKCARRPATDFTVVLCLACHYPISCSVKPHIGGSPALCAHYHNSLQDALQRNSPCMGSAHPHYRLTYPCFLVNPAMSSFCPFVVNPNGLTSFSA